MTTSMRTSAGNTLASTRSMAGSAAAGGWESATPGDGIVAVARISSAVASVETGRRGMGGAPRGRPESLPECGPTGETTHDPAGCTASGNGGCHVGMSSGFPKIQRRRSGDSWAVAKFPAKVAFPAVTAPCGCRLFQQSARPVRTASQGSGTGPRPWSRARRSFQRPPREQTWFPRGPLPRSCSPGWP